MSLDLADRSEGNFCFGCLSRSTAEDQDRFFAYHGLVRDHSGYAKLGDKVRAHCVDPDCGAERLISFSELARGTAPCLSCAEAADPDSPHLVYKIRFPGLRAWKIGITNTEARHDRISAHLARGGELFELHEVPNKEAARTVESRVLEYVRDFPSECGSRDFPQGGFTETWSIDGPEVDLGNLIASLVEKEASGFDRLRGLREYFAEEPVLLEEVADFVSMRTMEVDGEEVHILGLSGTEEQVLRKIRARRSI
ncbi:hypothetical protein AB0I72_26930 [Nocardiopsis sp. NPDC049922]|uniref:hypothetical protein n=1 Tax=Nocardiopsis sp. NPDC049922 TaxID=3155157 RepID=UPI0033DC0565